MDHPGHVRSTRRAGGTLTDITDRIEEDLHRWRPSGLLTGVFAHLDLDTGQLDWINAGHPPPLLIRAHHIVPGALEARGELPLGLGPGYHPSRTVHQAQLEPGDRVLIHTDGVTEARSGAGRRFGEDQLVDFVTRALAAGEPAPEALRRLIHAILDHHHGDLQDDATILLAEWHPDTNARPREPTGRALPSRRGNTAHGQPRGLPWGAGRRGGPRRTGERQGPRGLHLGVVRHRPHTMHHKPATGIDPGRE
ncbi:PP2C family protein-serine/threonine phosphatase [Streptomyces sp. NPDC090493]|uniref:PP2C family protein-serine/threonine phosphatase n=1 Tax=Streptomyces sp. NPDC090493 TaxID=3365964 RepID=UPI0037F8330A